MPSFRIQRVRELLKREIGEAIRREIPISEAGLISVNDVDVTGDLRQAIVYTSVLGTADQQKRASVLLAEKHGRIQDFVAKGVILKYTPRLRFVSDDSVKRGNRVLQIIEQLEKTDSPEGK